MNSEQLLVQILPLLEAVKDGTITQEQLRALITIAYPKTPVNVINVAIGWQGR